MTDAEAEASAAAHPAAPSGRLLGDLTAGAVVGLTVATFALSYTALVYAGPLAAAQPDGLIAIFTTCLVTGLGTALLSSLRFASASPDANSMVVLAAVAAGVGRAMGPTASPAALGATVLTMLMLAAAVIGSAMAVLGALRVGRIVRFVPYQVMAGFLGATGWSLAAGGLAVGVDASLHWPVVASPDGAAKLAATAAVGIGLLVLTPRLRTPFAVPATVAACIAAHHAVAAWIGVPIGTQVRLGWLLAAPTHLSVPIPWAPATLRLVDWRAMEGAAPGLFAALLVAVVTLMLNISALEVATGNDADIDRELRAGGLSAVASGLLGGTLGYIAVSRSLLLLHAGAKTRLAPCISAILAGLAPMLVPSVLALVPRPVIGGLLVFLGLQLLLQWVVRSRRSLSTFEWLTVLLVVAATIRFGFVVGVFTGVALGCATFAVAYSHAVPTRASYRGDVAASHVSRPARDRALLQADAAALLVLHLQGFLFFGTGGRLLAKVREEIAAIPGRLRILVLDFQSVDGIDGSATSSFARIGQVAAAERIVLILTAVPPAVAKRLKTVLPVAGGQQYTFDTLDEGLEWIEDARLAELRRDMADPPAVHAHLAASFGDAGMAARFITYLDERRVAAGTVIMRQHERSDELMFVELGRISILLSLDGAGERRARAVSTGAMLGEIGFLLGEPRTATLRADTDCRLLVLTRDRLRRIEQEDPALALGFHMAMEQFLAHRLIDKDAMIAALIRVGR